MGSPNGTDADVCPPGNCGDLTILGMESVAIAGLVIAVNVLLSLTLKLHLAQLMVVASLRCLVQLYILGLVLEPVFQHQTWYIVLAWLYGMILLTTREGHARPRFTYGFMFWHILGAISATAPLIIALATAGILQTKPWHEARYIIPLGGMVLGNALNGLTLGLDKSLRDYNEGRKKVELFLAAGASRWEASLPILRSSLQTGLTPTLQSMSIIGLVSIPGMMTGQILGGSSPLQAALYQVVIMYLVVGTTSMTLLLLLLLASATAIDKHHRLRTDLFTDRGRLDDIVTLTARAIGGWVRAAFLRVTDKG